LPSQAFLSAHPQELIYTRNYKATAMGASPAEDAIGQIIRVFHTKVNYMGLNLELIQGVMTKV